VVSEKYYEGSRQWKLPGGYVKAGESLSQSAVREVKEETGIDTEFLNVLCFRHMHPLQFNTSDMYFIVRLKPLSQVIVKEEAEIMDCMWMDIQKYKDNPGVNSTNRAIANLVYDMIVNEKFSALVPTPIEVNWKKNFYNLYTIKETK